MLPPMSSSGGRRYFKNLAKLVDLVGISEISQNYWIWSVFQKACKTVGFGRYFKNLAKLMDLVGISLNNLYVERVFYNLIKAG